MGTQNISVLYYPTSSSLPVITLNDVQSVSFSQGRQRVVDPYPVGTATIECRNIAAWTTKPKIGMRCQINLTINGDASVGLSGAIMNVRIIYGFTSVYDRAEITVEDALGDWGRSQVEAFSLASKKTGAQMEDLGNEINVLPQEFDTRSTASAQTVDGSALDYLNTLCITEYGHITSQEVANLQRTYFYGRNRYWSTTVFKFSDDATDIAGGAMPYESVEFADAADLNFTKIVVNPAGLATQTAARGSKPYRSLEVDTVDVSTAQADDLAEYLLYNFKQDDADLVQISSSWGRAQRAGTATEDNLRLLLFEGYRTGLPIDVVMRGTTFNCVIEGREWTATPEEITATWFLSGRTLNDYLLLNNTAYGILDSSKLGF